MYEERPAAALRAHFATDPLRHVEVLDGIDRGPEDGLSVFADDRKRPLNAVVVRWSAGPLGMSNLVTVSAGRVTGLVEAFDAVPRGRGNYSFDCPFWVAPALDAVFKTEVVGPVSRYVLDPTRLRRHPAAGQVAVLEDEDLEMVAHAFPRAVTGSHHRVLVLNDEPVAIAVTTELADGVARIGVHVPEPHRGRGFGGGVTSSLCEAHLAEKHRVVLDAPLGDEAAVRLVEGRGFVVHATTVRVNVVGRVA